MAQNLFELLRGYLIEYGYGAVAAALLLENSGIPVPGETVLLMASFLAFSEHQLHLPVIIVVGIVAATLGDNLGYTVGYYGGRPLLDRYRRVLHVRLATIARGEDIFRRYGPATIFVARFIAGLRVFAGPLAGVLRMPWRTFFLFNFLGAVLWVTVISSVGFFFGKHWEDLVRFVGDVNIAIALVVLLLVIFLVWKYRRSRTTTK